MAMYSRARRGCDSGCDCPTTKSPTWIIWGGGAGQSGSGAVSEPHCVKADCKATAVDSVDGFDQAFHELGELNHERQAHMRRKSVFASPRFRQFHQTLCKRLHDTGAADIVRFHIGARLLAVLYCFYDTDTCHYYQSGFTRKDSNRFMPLTLAHLMEMQRSRDAGKRYYDFMRGEPPTYKEEFDCETSALLNVAMYRWRWQRVVAVAYRHLRATAARGVRAVLRH